MTKDRLERKKMENIQPKFQNANFLHLTVQVFPIIFPAELRLKIRIPKSYFNF